METTNIKNSTSDEMGGEQPILPGKLPPGPTSPDDFAQVPVALQKAWTDYMVQGFKNNEEMFRKTLKAFMKPYYLTIWMYVVLFLVGIILFVLAGILSFREGKSLVTILFAGLGVTTFIAFFIRQPIQALEENLEFITWLGVAFNTYWTRLMYMMDTKTIQSDLKAADDDYCTSVERLITKHAELRSKRPGGDTSSDESKSGKAEEKE